jgi:hypothetical protein
MNGPDHYREAERLLDEATSRGDFNPKAQWCLELAKLHTALAHVAAAAQASDGREWVRAAGPRLCNMSLGPARAGTDLNSPDAENWVRPPSAATHGRTSHQVSGTRMHTTGPCCTGLHGLRATAIFYPDFYPKTHRAGIETLYSLFTDAS